MVLVADTEELGSDGQDCGRVNRSVVPGLGLCRFESVLGVGVVIPYVPSCSRKDSRYVSPPSANDSSLAVHLYVP